MKRTLMNLFFIFAISLSLFAQANQVNLASDITTVPLTKESESWFIQEFPKSFMSVYQNKTFIITNNGKPVILGPKDTEIKTEWLINTAKEEFQDYIINPKEGYKALLIQDQKKPIGAILYRLVPNEKTLYLAQFFILPQYQKKGIGVYLITNILPRLHPEYKRHEVLARHQNDAAFLLYKDAGFLIGDINIVEKYDYDPLRYISFFKVIH
jgi:ribosomal protein S18 acetylase RimI-like enzyme